VFGQTNDFRGSRVFVGRCWVVQHVGRLDKSRRLAPALVSVTSQKLQPPGRLRLASELALVVDKSTDIGADSDD
jgi:hypothetical protein